MIPTEASRCSSSSSRVGEKLGAPAHKNDAFEEVLYGIEGILTWTFDGTTIKVGPGQALCIPGGAVYRFDNLGKQDVKQLAIIPPRSWDRRTSARPLK